MELHLDAMVPSDRTLEEADQLLHWAGERLDANDTAHFQRQLEYLKAQTYDVKFGKLKSARFVPIDSSIPAGAESSTYAQWTEVQRAVVVANMADDLPQVDVANQEFTSQFKSIASSYQWSIQDVRRAAMSGMDFMRRKALAARNSIDRRIDAAAAFGIPEANALGMLNQTTVPIVTLPTAGAWNTLTAAQVLENMNFIASSIPLASEDVESGNTLLLDQESWEHVSVTPFLGGDGTDTILQIFLKNQTYVKEVDVWTRLNTAGAAGIHRIVCYNRSPETLQFNVPLPFEALPPQPKNLAFYVPCHARVGAVEVHYPLAMAYADVALNV